MFLVNEKNPNQVINANLIVGFFCVPSYEKTTKHKIYFTASAIAEGDTLDFCWEFETEQEKSDVFTKLKSLLNPTVI